MEGRITRQALNQSVWRHLIQIREEVAAYAKSIGCDMQDVCLFVGKDHESAFSIVEERDVEGGKHNIYLIDMMDGEDLHSVEYYEEEKNGQVVSDSE